MAFSSDQIRAKYDDIAPLYDRLDAVVERLGVRSLRRDLSARAHGRVLEVAIGTGRNIPLYGDAVRALVGVDLSPAMLRQALERARRAPFPVELHEADAAHLPFDSDSFDTVTSSLSTCTIPHPVAALREMCRVARPDARILLLEHGRSSTRWLARFQDWRAAAHEAKFGCRWNQEPRDLVAAAGLRIVSARRVFLGIFHVLEAAPASSPQS